MKLHKEGTNELLKTGCDGMILNHSKGHFSMSEKNDKFWYFATFGNFLKSGLVSLLFCMYSFLGMILINCQKMDLIELFKR